MTCKERILSNAYVDVLVDFDNPQGAEREGQRSDYCYHDLGGGFGILYLNRNELNAVQQTAFYSYPRRPKLFGPMSIKTDVRSAQIFDVSPLQASGIIEVQNPPLSLTGQGVILGFIDTGIDYTNQVFRRSDGSSRVLAIWDQTIQAGIPPAGIQYGTEYTREEINEALNSSMPYEFVPTRDSTGHGSALAGIAAGSQVNLGLDFLGAAPDADIVMVKLKEAKDYLKEYYMVPLDKECYAETDIIMGMQYLQSLAVKLQRPIVICLGLGSNSGDHNGSSIFSRYMDYVGARRNMAICICNGNEGNEALHYQGEITNAIRNNYDNVEMRIGAGEQGFILELWGTLTNIFTVLVRTPGGEEIPEVSFQTGVSSEYRFIYDRTVITIDYSLAEPATGEELVIFRFRNPSEGIWTIRVINRTNRDRAGFNMWLPIRQFLSTTDTAFLRPSPYITLTNPASTRVPISVSAYDDRNNSFYLVSGRGFSRDGSVKPELAAPGVQVSTVGGRWSGTGIAAAITAGASAQLMQWAVTEGNDLLADSRSLKGYLIRGANREDSIRYPSEEWGYGRLDVSGVFRSLIR